jgi:endonuclease YncB( thermonuclease family)
MKTKINLILSIMMKKIGVFRDSVFLVFILCALFCPVTVASADIVGKVAYVYDGDTFLLDSGVKVRLASIDAPETGKNKSPDGYFAQKAWMALKGMISRKRVRVEAETKDRYGRVIGWVYTSGGDLVNETMLRTGNAIFYKHKGNSSVLENKILLAQRKAVKDRCGLWTGIFDAALAKDKWVGNSKSWRCFPVSSSLAWKISKHHRKFFKNLEQAVLAGYSPARNSGFWPYEK